MEPWEQRPARGEGGELPEGYYLSNFETVLGEVRRRHGDLLHPGETARLETFLALPLGARRLFVRMLTRQGPWFRPESFRYPEIPDVPGALEALSGAGFCAGGEEATLAELLALLRREELGHWCRTFSLPFRSSLGRGELEARLREGADPCRLRDSLAASLGPVTPRGRAWARLCFLLFFGNGAQDLSAFVLADLGRVRYEAYPLAAGDRILQCREDVAFLLALEELREAFESGSGRTPGSLAVITEALLALEGRPVLRLLRRFHGLLNEAGREWERQGAPDRALACFSLSGRPPARERMARVLAALGRAGEAADQALAMAAAPWDEGEARFARRFLEKRAASDPRAAAWVEGHPPPPPPPEIRLVLPRHPSGSVEEAVLAWARERGWEGLFTENALWMGLFGLAFWEEIFAPVPGAFQHPFQAGPADLSSPDFHARRREALEGRLRILALPGALAPALRETAERKRGIANVFLNWRVLTPEVLDTALRVVPQEVVLSVLSVLAVHPRAFSSGFPDLLLHGPGPLRLWEVKGPGDTLRPEQERWLQHFLAAGVEAAVVRVRYEEG